MKKNYKLVLCLGLGVLLSVNSFSQAINETFNNVSGLFTSGWAQQNLSTPLGTSPTWFQGNPTVFVANSSPDSSYIGANYNSVAGTGTISNWLFAPNRTFQNGDVISFYTRGSGGSYPDRLEVRLSLNGSSVNAGTTNTSVGDFTTVLLTVNPSLTTTGYPSAWTQYSATISGLAGPTSGRVAFRYFVTNGGPTGSNSDYIGIDDFVYTPFGAAAPNVTVTNPSAEYTLIPLTQAISAPLQARVNNVGTGSTSDATLTVNVFMAPNFTTPIQTTTSSATTVAAGGNATLVAGSHNPNAIGTYRYQYISSCTGNTITSADTVNVDFNVVSNPNYYARDNGSPAQGVGAGNTISVIIGNNFKINTTTNLDSVLFFCLPGTAGLGDTIRVRIASTTAGVPSNTGYIGQSAIYRFTTADTTSNGTVKVLAVTNMTGGALSLAPGTYFVGLEKYLTSDNYGLQCVANIFTPNTVYANINNGAYSTLNSLIAGFNFTPIIRPYLRSCTSNTGSQTFVECPGFSVTVGTNTYSTTGVYTDVLTNVNGCDSTVTTNLTIKSTTTGSQTLVECPGFSVTVGTNMYTTTGIYTDVLIGANGCDSTVTTDLTIKSTTTGSQTLVECAGFSVTVGTNTYSTTGVYTDVLMGSNGCDSTVTTDLTINATDLTVTNASPTLTANQVGASYQWIDCDNGNAYIVGETSQAFTATANGNYAVEITLGSCIDTSACENVNTVGIKQNLNTTVSIYPNPTSGIVSIDLGNNVSVVNYSITTIEGRIIENGKVATNLIKVDLSNESKGVYLIKVSNDNATSVYRLIKQ